MVAFMLFLGMANAYIMRTNMSVAIVAMVDPNKAEKVNISGECPNLPVLLTNQTDDVSKKENYDVKKK